MVLADYQFYKEEFKGAMPKEAFERTIVRASAYVNCITFGRSEKQIEEAVRMAVCSVCDVLQEDQRKMENSGGHGEIKSENNDGYSVTYVTGQKDGETSEELVRRKAYQAAYIYLANTGLLYRGV